MEHQTNNARGEQKENNKAGSCLTCDIDTLKLLINELVKSNQIKPLRQLLRVNKNCTKLSTKELNNSIYRSGYKFVRRNGVMTYVMIKQKPENQKCLDICQSVLNNIKDN